MEKINELKFLLIPIVAAIICNIIYLFASTTGFILELLLNVLIIPCFLGSVTCIFMKKRRGSISLLLMVNAIVMVACVVINVVGVIYSFGYFDFVAVFFLNIEIVAYLIAFTVEIIFAIFCMFMYQDDLTYNDLEEGVQVTAEGIDKKRAYKIGNAALVSVFGNIGESFLTSVSFSTSQNLYYVVRHQLNFEGDNFYALVCNKTGNIVGIGNNITKSRDRYSSSDKRLGG